METSKEPIAIIGIGCRYPGASNPDALWRQLKNGESAVREIPADRFGPMDQWFDSRPATPGRIMSRFGGFLENIDTFDADFFGISPLEARQLDPQQRMLLEVAWEALEDAGLPAEQVRGASAGVFIGSWTQDFETRMIGDPLVDDLRKIDLYSTTGSGRYALAGRLSYFFDFQGPSLVVDTACSSSLLAIHLACRSLLQKECEIAVAGGVNIMLTPYITVAYSQSRMMAPDGHCKFGDARADGYVRSEGCGLVVLKPLSKALVDNDRIYAVILGGAVNNDGRASGNLTTPGASTQEELLRRAYRDAGVEPAKVQYVEAHGTGTRAGDPVELKALGTVLSEGRPSNAPCLVGSIKTNLGHTEGAAGVAGLIKVALAIKHRMIPASLNFVDPNPNVPWEKLSLRIPTQATVWPSESTSILAGVNAFGITGTNAHIVMGQAPEARIEEQGQPPASGRMNDKWILPLSAHSSEALREMARQVHATILSRERKPSIHDLCATATLKRDHHDFRMAMVARDLDGLKEGLAAFAGGQECPGVLVGKERVRPRGKIAFVYPGQGSQWLGMCRDLTRHSDLFRRQLQRCEEALQPYVDWSLLQQLEASEAESRLEDISATQPMLFAIQIALTELWKAWGVIPDAVIGHSMGEPAAAYVAGAVDLDAAAKIIATRSRLMKRTSGQGAMAVVELTMAQAAAQIVGREALLSIAVSNSPRSTVLSGDPAALEEVLKELEQRAVFCRKIKVDVASHSPQMEPLCGELVAAMAGLKPQPSKTPIYSTVAGALASGDLFGADYWGDNLRRPVRFAETIARMLKDGHTIFIEMSPHPVLLRAIDECAQAAASESGRQCVTLPSLLRKEDEPATLLESLGRLYLLGHPFDWRGLYNEPGQRVGFPPYPWQRERYWFEESSGLKRGRRVTGSDGQGRQGHAILEQYIHSALDPDQHLWEGELAVGRLPWLADHAVQGHLVFPAAGFIEASAVAAEQAIGAAVELRDMEFTEALFIDRDTSKRLQVVIAKESGADQRVRILSQSVDSAARPWREHASCRVVLDSSTAAAPVQDVEALRGRCNRLIPADQHYAAMQRLQLSYGPAFRGIERIGQGAAEAVARIRAPQAIAAEVDDFRMHPALLDTGLQLLVHLATEAEAAAGGAHPWMPVRVEKVRFFASQQTTDELWAVCKARPTVEEQGGQFSGDVFILDRSGRALVAAYGVVLRKIGYTLNEDVANWLYETEWQIRPLPGQARDRDGLLTGPDEIARQVAETPLPDQLRQDAQTVKEVLPRIESLCIDYIVQALDRLGLRLEPGQSFAADDLATRLNIQPRHRRLLERMLLFLKEEGLLTVSGDVWQVARAPGVRNGQAVQEQLLTRYPQFLPELDLLGRCGRHLAEVLTSAVDPLELLFPGGSLLEAELFYRDSIFARGANHQAGLALQAALASLPEGRRLKILEIGAGTGGLTSHLLALLSATRAHYVFTDIGAAFLTRAQEKYNAFPWVAYKVLDIEQDPVAQGFTPNQVDIVIAANCLHATRDMGETLAHVRMLLAPGGLMLLIEGTRAPRWIDMIFGLTEGWWRFKDLKRRPSHPLLDAEAWKTVTAESGFTQVEVFNHIHPCLFEQAVVVASAPLAAVAEAGGQPNHVLDKGAWLLFSDESGIGAALDRELSSRGQICRSIFQQAELPGAVKALSHAAIDGSIDPADPDHFDLTLSRFEKLEGVGPRAVVYLWPLDEFNGASRSIEQQRDTQKRLCGGLLLLAKAMAAREGDRRMRLWIVTRAALSAGQHERQLCLGAATLVGLAKVIDLEHPELRCRLIDLDGRAQPDSEFLIEALTAPDDEPLSVYRDGQRMVPRMIRLADRHAGEAQWLALPADEPFRLALEEVGKIDGVRIRPAKPPQPGPGEVVLRVRASGINFRDVLTILGAYPGDNPTLGLEAAGEVIAVGSQVTTPALGDEVIAVGFNAFGTFMVASAALTVPKPATMTFERAAALPIAFLTAHYGLLHLAGLKSGERVLIHAASGGVGLAAVQLAKAVGAEIFGTAGSAGKRAYLEALGVRHVLDSRSLDFADHIMRVTHGEGVDVVLNSLSDPFLTKSFEVLKTKGRFIEIGKRNILSNAQATQLKPQAMYEAFDLTVVMARQPELLGSMLEQTVGACAAGRLASLPTMSFPMEEMVGALRFMQQARHIGKIVLQQPRWGGGHAIDRKDAFNRQGTYLITGAFGGIGLGLVQWLFDRGARHFALIGRNAPATAVVARLATMEQSGARINTIVCDVASATQAERLFAKDLAAMPPLRGVFHLAGALDDGALIQQSWPRFEKVFAPKVQGAWNLHQLTRAMALDCFVLFSSWASFLGSQGQSNHSAANAFLDALAWLRRADGLPALSINWGAWAEVGAATKGDAAEHLRRRGIGSFTPVMGFRALGRLMSQGVAQAAVTPFDLALWRQSSPAAARSPWFEFLASDDAKAGEAEAQTAETVVSLLDHLRAAPSEKEQRQVLEAFLKNQVAQTLRTTTARIDANKPFKSYGMDSLTALEFRNRIEAATGATLSATLVFNYPTIQQLIGFLLEKLQEKIAPPEDAAQAVKDEISTSDDTLRSLLDEVESISEEDARRLLDDEH